MLIFLRKAMKKMQQRSACSSSTKKTLNKKFSPKQLSVVVAAMLMMGCQAPNAYNQSAYNPSTFAPKMSATQAFDGYANSADAKAKAKLMSALSEHMAKDSYALSTVYYKEDVLAHKNTLDEQADSVFLTFIKMKDFDNDSEYNDTAYRSMSDFLPMNGDDMLYLRYYDEIGGTTPTADYQMTRTEGVANDKQWVSGQLESIQTDYESCVVRASYEIDRLVLDNSAVTSNDAAFKKSLSTLDDCYKKQEENLNDLSVHLTGYQITDSATIRQCATSYRRNLLDALSPNRAQKHYKKEDNSYDWYDSVYANYGLCSAVFYAGISQDPVNYINRQFSENQLKAYDIQRQCALTEQSAQQSLTNNQTNYRTNPAFMSNSFYNYVNCVDDGVKKLYEKDTGMSFAPTTMVEAEQTYLNIKQDISQAEELAMYGDSSAHQYKGAFWRYFEMKKAELSKKDSQKDEEYHGYTGIGGLYGTMAGQLLESLQRTQAQVIAKNLYQYNHTAITLLTERKPSVRQYNLMMSLDFDAPTASQSVQLPILFDFNRNRVLADTSAALPLVAFVAPNQALLPEDFTKQNAQVGIMTFALPKALDGVIPLPVIYDSIHRSFAAAVNQLPDNVFSAVAADGDQYAKTMGADEVIKLNLSSREYGVMLAMISKQVVHDLNQYLNDHPEAYSARPMDGLSLQDEIEVLHSNQTKQKIQSAIEKWALLDRGFVSADVGGLLQIIEGVLPVDMYQSNYYYLKQGRLVGQSALNDLQVLLPKARQKMLTVTQYSTTPLNHPLAASLTNLANAPALDGNQLISDVYRDYKLKSAAQKIRDNYEDDCEKLSDSQAIIECKLVKQEQSDANYDSGEGNYESAAEEAAAVAAAEAAAVAAEIGRRL